MILVGGGVVILVGGGGEKKIYVRNESGGLGWPVTTITASLIVAACHHLHHHFSAPSCTSHLVCSVRLYHRNEARPGGSYQPCRGPVGGPSISWHHSTPQRDPRALQTRHGRGDYTKTALPEPQLKASTLKPVVSGEPPPSRHHASLAEDGLDRSTAPIGRPQTRVADSLCLLRLGVDALARSHTVQARIGRGMKPLVPGLHMSGLPCERSVGCASGLAMARARGAPVGDGRARVDAADACHRCASSLREDRGLARWLGRTRTVGRA